MVIILECALNTEHSECSMSCVRTVSTRAASRFSGVVAPRKHFSSRRWKVNLGQDSGQQIITPMRTSTLHPVPDLELQNAVFVAAQGLLVSKGTPSQRAGLIPLTCCVCHTIVLSHRASQVLNP